MENEFEAALQQAQRTAIHEQARVFALEHFVVLLARELEAASPGLLDKLPEPKVASLDPVEGAVFDQTRLHFRRLLAWAGRPRGT